MDLRIGENVVQGDNQRSTSELDRGHESTLGFLGPLLESRRPVLQTLDLVRDVVLPVQLRGELEVNLTEGVLNLGLLWDRVPAKGVLNRPAQG